MHRPDLAPFGRLGSSALPSRTLAALAVVVSAATGCSAAVEAAPPIGPEASLGLRAADLYGPNCRCPPDPASPDPPPTPAATSQTIGTLELELEVLTPCTAKVVPTHCLDSHRFLVMLTIRNRSATGSVLSVGSLPRVELLPVAEAAADAERCMAVGALEPVYEGGGPINGALVLRPGEMTAFVQVVRFPPQCEQQLGGWVRLQAVMSLPGERPGEGAREPAPWGAFAEYLAWEGEPAPCQRERYLWAYRDDSAMSRLPPAAGWVEAFGRADARSTEHDLAPSRSGRRSAGCCGDAYLRFVEATGGRQPYCLPESSLSHLLGPACVWPCHGPETVRSAEVWLWMEP